MTDFELQELQTRRQRAQELRQADMPQGRMVGRIYVNANPLEYLAAGLRRRAGTAQDKTIGEEMAALQGKREGMDQAAIAKFTSALRGEPARDIAPLTPMDDEGNQMPMARKEAVAPDAMAGYSALMGAYNPQLRQTGMQALARMPELEAQRQFQKDQLAAQNQARLEAAQAAQAAKAEQMQMAHQQRMDMMAAQNASREQMMQAQQQFQREMAEMRKQMGASSQPYFQPVQTAQGVMAFNARTGRMEPIAGADGKPVLGAQFDPALQGTLAGAKTGATTEAKLRTEARLDAPKAIAQGEETIRLVDDLLKAPGMKQAVGASRMLGIQKIPGTAAKDFDVRLDQLKGQQFLQAFESLKGGGAITEVEGKKATDAIARMDAASSEPEFTKAAKEFQAVIRQGVARARNAQGGQAAQPTQAAPKRIRLDAQGNIIP